MTRNFRTLKSLFRQGLLPLAGEVLLKLFGINLLKFYDAKYKDRNQLLGYDPDTIDFQALENFLSSFNTKNKTIVPIEGFLGDPSIKHWVSEKEANRLSDLLKANLSDKSTTHDYYRLYQPIINQLLRQKSQISLAEIGLGTNNLDTLSNMGAGGAPGASARSFRDFSPNINVYGADVDRRILFQEDRINTFYVDQLQAWTIDELVKISKPDLFIDDGLHAFRANLNVLNTFVRYAENNSKKWLVIEDLGFMESQIHCWLSILKILEEYFPFESWAVETKKSFVIVIRS